MTRSVGNTLPLSISGEGNNVTFSAFKEDMDADAAHAGYDIYLWERGFSPHITAAYRASDPGGLNAQGLRIAAGGGYATFASPFDALLPGPGNATKLDVYRLTL